MASNASDSVSSLSTVQLISDLSPYQKGTINALCKSKTEIKFWNNYKGQGKLFSMVLLDNSGAINCTAFQSAVDKFYNRVEVGKTYSISQYQLKSNKVVTGVEHEYEITLNQYTMIVPCLVDVGQNPSIRYDFTTIKKIEDCPVGATVDVIGICNFVAEPKTMMSKCTGQNYTSRDVRIIDSSNRLILLTLWGKQASDFNGQRNSIVAIKGARLKMYNNRKDLELVASSILHIDPDIPEAKTLRHWHDASQLSNISPAAAMKSEDDTVDIEMKELDDNKTKDDNALIPTILHNFTPINQIDKLAVGTLIDVIGICNFVAKLRTTVSNTTGQDYISRDVRIIDSSNSEIYFTLWGKKAIDFDGQLKPIVAIKKARLKMYNNRKNLELTFSSEIKINPDIPETKTLRHWFDATQLTNIPTAAEEKSETNIPTPVKEESEDNTIKMEAFGDHMTNVVVGPTSNLVYNFTPISQLAQLAVGTSVDVIGICNATADPGTMMSSTRAQDTSFQEVQLIDSSDSSICLMLSESLALNDDGQLYSVVAIKGARLNMIKDRQHLELVPSSILNINPDIPEAKTLRHWSESASRVSRIPTAVAMESEDDAMESEDDAMESEDDAMESEDDAMESEDNAKMGIEMAHRTHEIVRIPKDKLNFTPLAVVEHLPVGTIVDVIGICNFLAEPKTSISKATGKNFTSRDMRIIDTSNTSIYFTVWGAQVVDFAGCLNHIVAIKGAKLKMYGNRKDLSLTAICQVNINPVIPEADALRNWYEAPPNTSIPIPAEFEFLHNKLVDIDKKGLGTRNVTDYITVKATILFANHYCAVYKACLNSFCSKGVKDLRNGKYRCEKCACEFDGFKYLIAFELNIADETTSQLVNCFHKEAEKILNISAENLGKLKERDLDDYEEIFSNAVFSEFVFKLRVMMKCNEYGSYLHIAVVNVQDPPISVACSNYLAKRIKQMEAKLLV